MNMNLASSASDQASVAMAANGIASPEKSANYQKAKAAAEKFEGVFLSQMLTQMFKGVDTDQMFGGGAGEDMFKSLMIDEYGKEIAAQGGIGLAKPILNQLLAVQEHHAS